MATEIIVHVPLEPIQAPRMVELCDRVAEKFGLVKQVAGYMPDRRPVGYFYDKKGLSLKLSLFTMGAQPFAKIHLLRSAHEEASFVKLAIKEALEAAFPGRSQVIGEQ